MMFLWIHYDGIYDFSESEIFLWIFYDSIYVFFLWNGLCFLF